VHPCWEHDSLGPVHRLLADDSAEVRQSVGELVVRLLEGYGASRVAQVRPRLGT
jgi:hypothetical protein